MSRLTGHYKCEASNKILEALGIDNLSTEDTQIVKCENELCSETCKRVENCEECPINEAIKKLADYEDAEEQGLLFRLPVKVGDCIYLASKFYKKVERAEVIELHVGKFAKGFVIHNPKIGITKLSIKEIGKHVFFTETEAEAALKKM